MITKLWASGVQHLQHQNAYVVKTGFMLQGSDEEYSVPTVWTANDLRQRTPAQIAALIGALLENTINSVGDYAEMKAAELAGRPWPPTGAPEDEDEINWPDEN